jgi:hypothetical protein
MTTTQHEKGSLPVFGFFSLALAAVAAYMWHVTTASTVCQLLSNQTQTCTQAAMMHNVCGLGALALLILGVVCLVKRW